MKKCKTKYSTGGQIAATLAQFIPGYGQIISPLIGMADQMLTKPEVIEPKSPPVKMNTNVYGNSFKLGGFIGDGFKQYQSGSHASGNDLAIDQNGNPKNDGQSLIQNQENMVKINNKPYIMSDTLKNPKTGNTFNVDAAKVNKKYKNARYSTDEKNALNREMGDLAMSNDIMRANKESKQMAFGGPIDPLNQFARETTFVKPNPFIMPQLPTQESMYTLKDGQPRYLDYGDIVNSTGQQSGKSMSKVPRFREKAYGGPLDNTNPLDPLSMGYTFDPTQQERFMTIPPDGDFMNLTLSPDPQLPTIDTNYGTPLTGLNDRNQQQGIMSKSVTGNTPSTTSNVGNIANAVGLGLKGIALGRSLFDSLQPAQYERPILPDYSNADRYLQEVNIDYSNAKQQALGVSNMAGNMNRSATRSFGQFSGREAGRFATLGDQISNINQQQSNANSALNVQKSQYEAGKAQGNRNILYENSQSNMQNEANTRGFQRDFFKDLSVVGSGLNQFANTQKLNQNNLDNQSFQTKQMVMLLSQKYPSLEITPDILEKIKSGASIDDIVKYKK